MKNLIFTSAGQREFRDKNNNPIEGTAIESWNDGDREFDIVVYCYDESLTGMGDCDVWVQRKGTKYQNFYHYAINNSKELEQYDYVWVVDDDMFMSTDDINKMFMMMEDYNIDLGQPSMDNEGMHYIHFLINDPDYTLRYTNYIECSAPIFSKPALQKILPTFNETITGFGWDALISDMILEEDNVAVFDNIKAYHAPSMSTINKVLHRAEHSVEGNKLLKKYNKEDILQKRDVLSGILLDGKKKVFVNGNRGSFTYRPFAKWRIRIKIMLGDVVTWEPEIMHYPKYQWRR